MKTISVLLGKPVMDVPMTRIPSALQQKSNDLRLALAYITKDKNFVLQGQASDGKQLIKIMHDPFANRIITFSSSFIVQRLRFETAVGLTICDENLPTDPEEYKDSGDQILNLLEQFDMKSLPSIIEQVDVLRAGNETARYWRENANMQENPQAWFSAARTQGEINYLYYGKTLKLKNKKKTVLLSTNNSWNLGKKDDLLVFSTGDNSNLAIKDNTAKRLLVFSVRKSLTHSPVHII